MSGPGGEEPGRSLMRESDVVAVGRLIDADRGWRSASQRVGRATDALTAVYGPERRARLEVETAQRRLYEVEQAQAAAGEWAEALAQQRDAVAAGVADRQAATGRGPRAWAARSRLESRGYDRNAHAVRVTAAAERAREAAGRVGTADPRVWHQQREQAEDLVQSWPARRGQLLAEQLERLPAARAALAAAQDQAQRAEAARAAAVAEVDRLGLDSGRVTEVAVRGVRGGVSWPSADDRTERALVVWEERQAAAGEGEVRVELDAPRAEPGPDRSPER